MAFKSAAAKDTSVFIGRRIRSRANGQITNEYDDQGRPIWMRREDGTPICGSKNHREAIERTGHEFCHSTGRLASGRCRSHGKVLRGAFHPNTGGKRVNRWLADIPERLQQRYKEALEDEDLTDLRSAMSLNVTRISELLRSLSTNNSVETLAQAAEVFKEFEAAFASENQAAVGKSLTALSRLLRRGAADYYTWRELVGLLRLHKEFSEADTRIHVQQGLMASVEEVHNLLAELTEIFKASVITNLEYRHSRQVGLIVGHAIASTLLQLEIEVSDDDLQSLAAHAVRTLPPDVKPTYLQNKIFTDMSEKMQLLLNAGGPLVRGEDENAA